MPIERSIDLFTILSIFDVFDFYKLEYNIGLVVAPA